jgi:hypothetical protein
MAVAPHLLFITHPVILGQKAAADQLVCDGINEKQRPFQHAVAQDGAVCLGIFSSNGVLLAGQILV